MNFSIQIYWILDSIIAMTLITLAIIALNSKRLFKSILFFITFGLLLTLVLVRLNAPDVAMAEAAIGAGVTGALLLATLRKLKSSVEKDDIANNTKAKSVIIISITLLSIPIIYAIYSLPHQNLGLQDIVEKNMDISGVTNPVTAVLLNFRAYDTLLEMFVLLSAILGILSLETKQRFNQYEVSPILETLSAVLIPILILTSGYILWIGASAPGGAFQAGAILGAAGVLFHLLGKGEIFFRSEYLVKVLLIIGPLLFLLTAVFTALIFGSILKYPVKYAGVIILILESFATISIAATLVLLYHSVNYEKRRLL